MTATQQYSASLKRQIVKQFLSVPKAGQSLSFKSQFDEAIAKISLHEKQRHILETAKRFNVPCCGRRFGKTTLTDSLILPVMRDAQPACYFQPINKMVKFEMRKMLVRLRDLIEHSDMTDNWILFKGGGRLDFWSYESFDNIRGRFYKRAILDETAFAKTHKRIKECWEEATRPALVDLQGDAWFLSTPKNGYYEQLFKNEVTHPEDWKSWRFSSYENPFLDVEELAKLTQDMPELVRMQEIEAQFVEMSGTAIKREHLQYGNPPSHDNLTITMGVDLAISTKTQSDYTAAVVLGRDEEGNVYILDAKRVRAEFQGVLAFIAAMAERWQPREIAIENVQYQASVIQELRRTTALPIRAVRPDKDKVTRFMPLQTRYEQKLVFHAEHLSKDFESELLAFPVGAHDDMIDAAAYAFAAQNKKQVRILTFDD